MYNVKKVNSFRGHEGYGFNAHLFRDDKEIALVIDAGCGGCLYFEWVEPKEKDILVEYVKTLPVTKTQFGDMRFDIDLYVSQLVDGYETDKRMKRHCKTKTLYRLKSDKDDVYRVINRRFDSEVKEFLKKKYVDTLAEIVNERWS